MLLSRLLWSLSIYNLLMIKIEKIQGFIMSASKKWLGLPKLLSTFCFYSKSSKLQFPFTELCDEVKVAKARNLVTLQESDDKCIKRAKKM